MIYYFTAVFRKTKGQKSRGFSRTEPFGRQGRAGLRLAPTPLQSNVCSSRLKNEYFDDPVSLIFRWFFDLNGVGATRRGARPGRPEGKKSRPAVLRRLRAFFCKKRHGAILDDWRSAHFINRDFILVNIVLQRVPADYPNKSLWLPVRVRVNVRISSSIL